MTRKPAFRVCREVRTSAGYRRVDVPNRLGSDTTIIHADSAEAAVQQARAFGLTGALVAFPEAN